MLLVYAKRGLFEVIVALWRQRAARAGIAAAIRSRIAISGRRGRNVIVVRRCGSLPTRCHLINGAANFIEQAA